LNATISTIQGIKYSERLTKKRIIVITDGEGLDNAQCLDICDELVANSILVDALVLDTGRRDSRGPVDGQARKSIVPVCEITSGRAFLPDSLDEALALFRREDFIDLSFRVVEPYTPNGRLDQTDLELFKMPIGTEFNGPIKKQPLVGQLSRTDLGAFRRGFRELRIAEEFNLARASGFHVYGTDSNPSINVWRVFVEWPHGDSKNALWELLVTFPSDYPFVPPVFRFIAVPPISGVTESGRFCSTAISNYLPSVRVAHLLHEIGIATTYNSESRIWEDEDAWRRLLEAGEPGPIPNIKYIKRQNRRNPNPIPVGNERLPAPRENEFPRK
jgi:ubiquitin-protein ligase